MAHKGNGPARKGYRAEGQKTGLMRHCVLRLYQESISDSLPTQPRYRQDVSAPCLRWRM